MTFQDEVKELDAQIEALQAARRAVFQRSIDAPDGEKAWPDWLADGHACHADMCIRYPVEVVGIHRDATPALISTSARVGSWVACQPCEPELVRRTYLGVLLGYLTQGVECYLTGDGVLSVGMRCHNPAMWIPALKRVVMGSGSNWHVISSPEELQQITREDVEGAGWMKALRELEKEGEA